MKRGITSSSSECVSRDKFQALKKENKALRETLEILGNSMILRDIKKSLADFEKGRRIRFKIDEA